MVGSWPRATLPLMPQSTQKPASDRANPSVPRNVFRSLPSVRSGSTLRHFSWLHLAALGLAVLLAFGAGCDRNIEAFQPGEEPSPPDLARIFPAPAGGVGSGEAESAGGAANAAAGQPARGAVPPARAESATAQPAESAAGAPAAATEAAPIEGEIDIAAELADARPPGAILFVIARNAGARRGPPLAVLRIPEPSFPLAFSIGPENVMIPTMQFAGSISLSARLDADGNAMTRGAGDISSAVQEPLAPGATGVRLLLDQPG